LFYYCHDFGLTALESSITSFENLISLLRGLKHVGVTRATISEKGFNHGIVHKKGSCLNFSTCTFSKPLIMNMSRKEV